MDADGHQSFLRSVILGAWGAQPSSNKHRRLPRGHQTQDSFWIDHAVPCEKLWQFLGGVKISHTETPDSGSMHGSRVNWYMGAVSFASSTFLPSRDHIWCIVCVFVSVRVCFCAFVLCLCQHCVCNHWRPWVVTYLQVTCIHLRGSTKPTHPTGLITVFICFSQKKYSIHNIVIYNHSIYHTYIHLQCAIIFVHVRLYVLED